jgi:hypothetical protein
MSYPITIPDREYWKQQIKCQYACPVHTDARGYVRAIAEGDDRTAYLIARGPNPLASMCGRVCGAPCEQACRRGDFDQPIAIRALKRYVCAQFGPEGQNSPNELIDFLKQSARGAATPCADKDELLPLLQSLTDQSIPRASGKSVGIIGSGPAGLACAHDLALLGFDVTIYEMEPVLAGCWRQEYLVSPAADHSCRGRCHPRAGVNARTSCQVGKDVAFANCDNCDGLSSLWVQSVRDVFHCRI